MDVRSPLCSSESTGWILAKHGGNDPYVDLFIVVCCIYRSYKLQIDFRDENIKYSYLEPQGIEP